MWEKISRLMDEKNITPYKLAKDNGFKLSTVYNWREQGKVAKVDDLEKIANYFNVPMVDLL